MDQTGFYRSFQYAARRSVSQTHGKENKARGDRQVNGIRKFRPEKEVERKVSFISDTYYMFLRWMKKLVRNPILLFFSLFQPIIFLLLFTQLFSSFGLLLGVNYTLFATAAIVLQNAYSSAYQSATAIVHDIKSEFRAK